MSTPAQVYTALITILQGASDLSYVSNNAILLGARDRIDNFPCIIIEDGFTSEQDSDIIGYVDLHLQTTINAFVQVTDVEKQIVGDTTTKGTADMVNDIKKSICADRTLGGVVIDCTFKDTVNNIDEWPLRVVGINIDIFFRQNSTSRT